MKKVLAGLLAVALLTVALPLGSLSVSAATSGTTGYCTWTLDGTRLTISGNGAMGNFTSNGYLPWGKTITSVTIQDGVTTIGNYAFSGCSKLTSVTMGDSVTAIGNYAFYGCSSLTSVTIKDGVTAIGDNAFSGCTALTYVGLPNTITTFGGYVFYGCNKLTTVYFGGTLEQMAQIPINATNASLFNATWRFSDGSVFESIKSGTTGVCLWSLFGTHLIISGTGAMLDYSYSSQIPWGTTITAVSIGDGVTAIGDNAFFGCSKLTSVTMGNGVTTIGDKAFYGCNSLTDANYNGSEEDRAAIAIGAYNDPILNATWHYKYINPKDLYSDTVTHSVMDTDRGSGLAFRFELSAQGVTMGSGSVVDLTNATVNYLGTDCKLVGMGAVLTNDAKVGNSDFTREQSTGQTVIDIPAIYLQEATDTSCAFAIRLINIPATQLERTIYARPYFVVEYQGEEVVVYGDVDAASCAEYM